MNDDDEIGDLLAGRALHALSPDEERALESALVGDPDARRGADRDAETAAWLAEAVPEVAPPAHVREELLARIAGEEQRTAAEHGAASPTARRRAKRPRRARFVLAASIALLLTIGIGAATISQFLDRPEAVVALERIESADDARVVDAAVPGGGTVALHWAPSSGEAVVVADGIPELTDGQQYELWNVRGETPVSAGVFDGGTTDPTLLAGEVAPGDVVAVTIEQAGGSPTGAPTTEPIVALPAE
ncbi:anti-sigma factor [Microbacterium betulae]|uniref:Regulator of SigK n=1 Tax=Microbacterium betulae TaxID=2981139 RepID=A0AA97FDE9_9MICO|nr:anti-sigma factor [Microbacterium sp. AB]WOF21456.1 anti-sigma factor [Microbacterium sp. AB]